VHRSDSGLAFLHAFAQQVGLASGQYGLISDIIAARGMVTARWATARSIPNRNKKSPTRF